MKKIGIATVFGGYNYGSALQAYATKQLLSTMGYRAELLQQKGSLFKGRDVRIKKLFVILLHAFLYRKQTKGLYAYKENFQKKYSESVESSFLAFTKDFLQPASYSYKKLKKIATTSEYHAFICGSDQIWKSDTLYLDPFYFLRFAPKEKRIAFSPSFGREYVPEYNKKVIGRYILDIPHISVREESGRKIIEDLVNKKVEVTLDPTLTISSNEWRTLIDDVDEVKREPYILAYFLDTPLEETVQFIKTLKQQTGHKVLAVPYSEKLSEVFDECIDAGPREFLKLIDTAYCVVTDSFHGTAFSLTFNKPFFVFNRNYGASTNQSTRIYSLLNKIGLENRFSPSSVPEKIAIDYEKTNLFMERERHLTIQYLSGAIHFVMGEKDE